MKNFDRITGTIVAIITLVALIAVLANFTWQPIWFMSLIPFYFIYEWIKKGIITIPVGHKGVPEFMEERMEGFILNEGKRWLPFPLSCVSVDCRKTTLKLDPLEGFTEDNIKATIMSTLVYEIDNPYVHLGVDQSKFKQGLDDIKDGLLREMISKEPAEKVIKMHADLSKEAEKETVNAGPLWGVKVIKFTVTDVKVDVKVEEDLELKKREELQREGQKVELEHFADRIKELTRPIEKGGPGLSQDEAIRQVRIALGQLKPTEAKQTFGLDANIAALIATILQKVTK